MSGIEKGTWHLVMGRRGQTPKLISREKRTKLSPRDQLKSRSQALLGRLILFQESLCIQLVGENLATRRDFFNTGFYCIYSWLVSLVPSMRSTTVCYDIAECKWLWLFPSFLDWRGRWLLTDNLIAFFPSEVNSHVTKWVWTSAEPPS